jgi:hypothetical protein
MPADHGLPAEAGGWIDGAGHSRPHGIRIRRAHSETGRHLPSDISLGEFDASVRGWIAHAAHADTWGLRQLMLESFVLKPGDTRIRKGRRSR